MLQSGKIELRKAQNSADAIPETLNSSVHTTFKTFVREFADRALTVDLSIERMNDHILSLVVYLLEMCRKSLSFSTSLMASFGSSIAPPWAKTAWYLWAIKGDFSDLAVPSERRIVSSISHWIVLPPSPQETTNHLSLNRTDNFMISVWLFQLIFLPCALVFVKQKVGRSG